MDPGYRAIEHLFDETVDGVRQTLRQGPWRTRYLTGRS